MAQLAFWAAAGLIVYAYVGFPVWLAARAWLAPRPAPRRDGKAPSISYVIVAYNEAEVIARKLDNVFAMEKPHDQVEVILASDGSDDGTLEAARAHPRAEACLFLDLPRAGKNATLNAAVARARGEILVFSDADSMLAPDAMKTLVAPFSDPSIGGVAGRFEYEDPERKGEGERAYWSVDRVWKRLESQGGQLTSATGQIYAIRRSLFTFVPDGVTDDFFVSTGVVEAGQRLFFEEDSVAVGPVAESPRTELRRKVRVASRGLASVWARRRLLDPTRHGFYAIQLASHKVLRRLVGLPLLVLWAASIGLAGQHPFYAVAAIAQTGFHGLAWIGWLLKDRPAGRSRALSLPLYFDLVNLAGTWALIELLRGKRHRTWSPERSGEAMRAEVET